MAAPDVTEACAQPTQRGRRLYAIIAVLMMVEMLSSLEHSMIISALPAVVREQGVASAGWIMTAFLLAQAATAAVGGRLGDMFGRRRVLLILILLCCAGSVLSAVSTDFSLVIVGRVIQGASGAILPLCYGIARQVAPRETVPFYIGVLTGGFAFASGAGFLIGGILADLGDWRLLFWVTAGFSAFLVPPLLLVVPNLPGGGAKQFDVLGAVLFAPAIAAVLYGITVAPRVGWSNPGAWGWIVSGALLLAWWARHELRHPDPLIELRLLRRREIALGNLFGVLASASLMQLPIVMMMILQQPAAVGVGLGVSATLAGLLKVPSNLGALIAAPLSGWLSGRRGSRFAVLQGALIASSGWVLLFFLHDSVLQVVIGTIVGSFGAAMLLAAIPNLVLEGTPIERSSEVTGLVLVSRGVAAGIGSQVVMLLLSSSQVIDPASGAAHPAELAYQLTFAAVAGTGFSVALASVVLGRRTSLPLLTRRASDA